ncbi:biosynthetic-type acetolactate synthase large subunit [Caloramator sp. E03]|uniref:biosynthetic-type acetolactate synthase large subunit n=1 Tax=Caloramator sp. E03 TaxID=2576307 RepID=UPI001110E277|nr:biosynthetic-type acetolactate synthase large subunit [Caloramator sp. E03]QCX34863.1 biosynthetic-type acetolactate synthase large subunit [Caloramator sp. E03]
MYLTGAQIVLECLKEHNVDVLFGYPGGAVIPLYDALYDERNNFMHIRTAHEQGAVHGADGYSRSTGKVGVCIATSGPGATNTITGIATAYMDSTPLLVITGQVPSNLLGRDSFQEIDITGVTIPITKNNYLVKNVELLAPTLREAFKVAVSDRPGPVLVDITKDVFLSKTEYVKCESEYKNDSFDLIEDDVLKRAAKLINDSKRPVIYAGGGVKIAKASDVLIKIAKKACIPVVNTLMGLGTIPRNDELSLGLVGMHGFREANLAVSNSDLLIAIGARFSDRVVGKNDSFAKKAKIIHIDIDESEFGKNVKPDIYIAGNLKSSLEKLYSLIEEKDRKSYIEEIRGYAVSNNNDEGSFLPKNIIGILNKKFDENCFVATDVGQHQMWTAQHWKFKSERGFITSGGLGTMGFGLGAAIGCKIGNPDSDVVLITGDGSFRMNCNELATVSKYNIPILIVLMNNKTLGMVRQWQRMFSNKRYSETDVTDDVDYIKLVNAYGIEGFKVNTLDELNSIVSKINKLTKPLFIQCDIEKNESVYPIVPPGMPIENMLFEG